MSQKKYTDENGNIICATGTPVSGGEGDVYKVEGHPELVVKIYNAKKRSKKSEYSNLMRKLQAMCKMCDEEIMSKAGWPQRIVYSNGKPVGFVMNKIRYCNTFHQLVDTIDRKYIFGDNTWKYMIQVAYNLACAVHVLHSKNIVIGDINESNFLIGNRRNAEQAGVNDYKENAIVYYIDCDSFQIITEEEEFLCSVAKPEYIPPELIRAGKKLSGIVRTQNHDNFGLAVLIFQLLMLNVHPYGGVGTPGSVSDSILSGCYIFGKDSESRGIYPPKPIELNSKIFYSLNEDIRALFERAFSSAPNVVRPTAEEWILALQLQLDDMAECSEHHYYNKNGECVWCQMKHVFNPWEQVTRNKYSQTAYNQTSGVKNKKTPKNTKKQTQTSNRAVNRNTNSGLQSVNAKIYNSPNSSNNFSFQKDNSVFAGIILPILEIAAGTFLLFFDFVLKKLLKPSLFALADYLLIIIVLLIFGIDIKDSFFTTIFFISLGFEFIFRNRWKYSKRLLASALMVLCLTFVFNIGTKKNKTQEVPEKQSVQERSTDGNSSVLHEALNRKSKSNADFEKKEAAATSSYENSVKKEYLKEVTDTIQQNWYPPAGVNGNSVKTKFRLDKNGELLNCEVVESSGIDKVDDSATQAIISSAPFKKFPSAINHNYVNITYTFEN